jgi:AAA domain-containing protein
MSASNNSGRRFTEVTKSSPCPVCGGDDFCAWCTDGTTLLCERSRVAPPGSGLRFLRHRNDGAMFRRDDGPGRGNSVRPSKSAPGDAHRWPRVFEHAKRELTESRRVQLASQLGVRWEALADVGLGRIEGEDLRRLKAGWSGAPPDSAFVFAERDGEGHIIGLSLRAHDGSKGAPLGSRRGLTVPASFRESRGVVLIVEGASDVAAARTLGLMAVGRPSNASGADKLAKLLEGRSVLVIGENDAKPDGSWPGRNGAMRIAESLAESWSLSVPYALPPSDSKDVRAWLTKQVAGGLKLDDDSACRDAGAELLDQLERGAVNASAEANRAEPAPFRPLLRPFSTIERRDMEWLWRGRLPLGKLVMVAGEPGTGKSTMVLDLAARVSRGDDWPDGEPCERGAVLLLSAEDDPEDTTGPRLDVAGADGSLVVEFAGVSIGEQGQEDDRPVEIADLPALEDVLRQGVTLEDGTAVPFRLVVIDPLMAYMSGADTNKSSDVRGALRPLAKLAERARVTILFVQHPRKDDSHNALNIVSGSKAFVEAVRAAWMVTRDPEDKGGPWRLFMPFKGNVLAPSTRGLRFRLEEVPDGRPNEVRTVWSDVPVERRIDQVLTDLANREGQTRPRGEAEEFLREILADGPMPSNELFAEAASADIKVKTLRRAFKDMGRKPTKTSQGHWEWSLPDSPTQGTFDDGGHLRVESPANVDEQAARNGEGAHPSEDAHPPGCGESDGDANREEAGDA